MNITQVIALLKDLSLDINDERLDASIKALELNQSIEQRVVDSYE